MIEEFPTGISMTVDSCKVEVLKLISVALSPSCFRLSISCLFWLKFIREMNLLSCPWCKPSIFYQIQGVGTGEGSAWEVSRLHCSVVLEKPASTFPLVSLHSSLPTSKVFLVLFFVVWGWILPKRLFSRLVKFKFNLISCGALAASILRRAELVISLERGSSCGAVRV